jgi:hypothetical protein
MKCHRIQQWISEEMDGQLAPEHVAPLAEHLQACDECRTFREDLRVGTRMLHATEPTLPDDFDWKLQLRLSRAMRDAARQSHPWQDAPSRWRPWLMRAGISGSVGLAAVLTLALLLPADTMTTRGESDMMAELTARRLPMQVEAPLAGIDATRRPLQVDFGNLAANRGFQRTVSSRSDLAANTIGRMSDLEVVRIRKLEQDNETLRRLLFGKDRQIQYLQAQLDSLTRRAVDRN